MTITFENDNNVIVYALVKIISYARENQYIILAQSIWWISSVIGLQQGSEIYIDTLKERLNTGPQEDRRPSTANHIQEDLISDIGPVSVHPERRVNLGNTIEDISNLDRVNQERDQQSRIVAGTKRFIQRSKTDRRAFKKWK